MKISEALKQGVDILSKGKSEINMPLLDAQIILCHVTDRDKAYLIAHSDEILTELGRDEFFDYINKRASGCPIAYLTGKKEFMGLEFFVDENVLIPRDDTEILVNCVLDFAKQYKNPKILNIGVGSGCIEVAIAHYNTDAEITGIEKYDRAICIAQKNIDRYSLGERIRLIKSDMFDGLDNNEHFDIICSNPPYITKDEMESLSIDVLEFEPYTALYGGEDGLDFYKIIASQAKEYLNSNGLIAVEIGYAQKESVCDIFIKKGYENITCHKDLSGYDRVVTAQYIK
ncbi:MAG: peptide chain release factor N(5)-glutamine methyltransferase [Eubacteriaceae bacterium]|nr:peptide chain release factor N(5)-glutamine methyltransferase [Eubacteriaceae bacterium]